VALTAGVGVTRVAICGRVVFFSVYPNSFSRSRVEEVTVSRRPVPPLAVRIVRYAPVLPGEPSEGAGSGRAGAAPRSRPARELAGGRGGVAGASRSRAASFGAPSGWRSFREPVVTYSTDGALALSRGLVQAPSPTPLRLVQAGENVETELRVRAEATVRIIVDVLAGMRPAHRLSEIAIPTVCRELARRWSGPERAVPPQVLSSWLQQPARDAVEVGAVVIVGGHVKALAARLELRRGRWRCAALETTGA